MSRKFHTYEFRFNKMFSPSSVEVLTLCPDCMHNDSLSTTSLRLIILSSIRVIVTSSSEGLDMLVKPD